MLSGNVDKDSFKHNVVVANEEVQFFWVCSVQMNQNTKDILF